MSTRRLTFQICYPNSPFKYECWAARAYLSWDIKILRDVRAWTLVLQHITTAHPIWRYMTVLAPDPNNTQALRNVRYRSEHVVFLLRIVSDIKLRGFNESCNKSPVMLYSSNSETVIMRAMTENHVWTTRATQTFAPTGSLGAPKGILTE